VAVEAHLVELESVARSLSSAQVRTRVLLATVQPLPHVVVVEVASTRLVAQILFTRFPEVRASNREVPVPSPLQGTVRVTKRVDSEVVALLTMLTYATLKEAQEVATLVAQVTELLLSELETAEALTMADQTNLTLPHPILATAKFKSL